MRVTRIIETCLYVENLDEATRFYQDVLGLEVFASVSGRHTFFRCEGGVFLLFDPQQTIQATGTVPPHGAHGSGHVAFAMADADVEAWRDRLRSAGVVIEADINWPGGGQSLYFRDPAGNSVELTTPSTWGIPVPGK